MIFGAIDSTINVGFFGLSTALGDSLFCLPYFMITYFSPCLVRGSSSAFFRTSSKVPEMQHGGPPSQRTNMYGLSLVCSAGSHFTAIPPLMLLGTFPLHHPPDHDARMRCRICFHCSPSRYNHRHHKGRLQPHCHPLRS